MVDASPFVYVAALPRSGSTLLAELLSDLPRSVVLVEPEFHNGRNQVSRPDVRRVRRAGIRFSRRWFSGPDRLARLASWGIANNVLLGVKEITHQHLAAYRRQFTDFRVVLLGRDPIDIHGSLVERCRVHQIEAPHDYTGRCVEQWQYLQNVASDALRVRYEDLCRSPVEVVQSIRKFVAWDVGTGRPGQHLQVHHNRSHEHARHGGEVTNRSVCRHALTDGSLWFRDSLAGYRELFGY